VLLGKVLLYRRQNRARETIHLSGFLFLGLSLLIVCSIVLLELLTFLTAQKVDWVVVLVVVETVAVLVVLVGKALEFPVVQALLALLALGLVVGVACPALVMLVL
jgi:hypothetical protein